MDTHKLSAVVVVTISLLLLAVLTYGVLKYYREKSVPFIYSSVVYLAWYLGFVGIILFPIDIGYSTIDSKANETVKLFWDIVYWVTFFTSWVFLPLMMEYWGSGEFKKSSRFKESLWINAKFYITIAIVAVPFAIWFITTGLSLSSVQGWIIGLVNTYGLLFVILLLGIGLVDLPITLWGSRDMDRYIEGLYKKEYQVDADKSVYRMQIVSLKRNLGELKKIMLSAKRSSEIMGIVKEMEESMPTDEEVDMKNCINSAVDESEWIKLDLLHCMELSDIEMISVLSKEMNSRIKRACLHYQRVNSQFDEITDAIIYYQDYLSDEKLKLNTNYQLQTVREMSALEKSWMRCRRVCLTILAIVAAVLSAVTLLTEITTVLYQLIHKPLSIFGLFVRNSNNQYLRIAATFIPLSYLFYCYFRSFFLLHIPGVECYNLNYRHTDVYALSFNASYISRIQFSLCYHFFVLLQMDEGMYDSIALSSLMGQMKTIPFLGKEFNFFMPIILVLISAITLVTSLVKKRKQQKENRSDSLIERHSSAETGKLYVENSIKRRKRLESVTISTSDYNYVSPILS